MKPVIAIHGGAGTLKRSRLKPELEAQFRSALAESLTAGYSVLNRGEPAQNGVVAAIQVMEESALFNAGVGSVFTHAETVEMDASIMSGADHCAGAVAGIAHIRSPIALAQVVMQESEHVFLIGSGAEEFAREQGFEVVQNSYFHTDWRRQQLLKVRDQGRVLLDHDSDKFGTVGAVARDMAGNLAAGTSTGGMTNKRYGRVGDSPLIGAGTYADNATCAVSATGHGEYFIRAVVAYDIAARMRYAGETLERAAHQVVMERLTQMGGEGGVVAVDAQGCISMPFNSEGMYRGCIDTQGDTRVRIFSAE